MALFHFLNKKTILFRCTECYSEFELSTRELRQLGKKNRLDQACPLKDVCHFCHTGFIIPVKYTDKHGKKYLFHEIKPKIKNLDQNSVFESIFENPDNEIVMFFPPET